MTLTPTEARILAAIEYTAPGTAPVADICQYVYGYEYDRHRDDALIRVHVANLRRKLGGRIQTVRGVGYRLVAS